MYLIEDGIEFEERVDYYHPPEMVEGDDSERGRHLRNEIVENYCYPTINNI